MTQFVRVRGKTPGDPLHEFDVPLAEAEKHPEIYEVIDPKPVAETRPASFVSGVVPAKKSPRVPKRAGKNPGENSTAPAGADS